MIGNAGDALEYRRSLLQITVGLDLSAAQRLAGGVAERWPAGSQHGCAKRTERNPGRRRRNRCAKSGMRPTPRVVPLGDANYPRCNNRTGRVRCSRHGHFQPRQGDGEPRQVVRPRRMGCAATRGLRGALRTRHRQPRLARRCARRTSGRGRGRAGRLCPRGLLHRPVRRARRAKRHRRLPQAPRLARIGARQALPGGAEGFHRVPLRGSSTSFPDAT